MTSTTGLTERTDSRRQIRISRKKREALLAQFDQSGVSEQKFAKQAGIKYTTFANWLQKRRRHRNKVIPASTSSPGRRSRVRWLEAVVDSPQQKNHRRWRRPRWLCMGRARGAIGIE
jgi:lambda repressor-like predicted transcriptional regulator